MSEDAPSRLVTPARAIALVRIALVVAISVSERAEGPIELGERAFDTLIVAAVLWSLTLGVMAIWELRSAIALPEAFVDLALLGGLTYSSGGAFSEVRQAFFVVPVIAAATQRPMVTALWSLAGPTVFTAAALAEDVGNLPGAETTILTGDVYLAAIGAASVLTSVLLRDRGAEALAYAERSRSLSQQLLEIRDAERRELAHGLHDHPVQLLGAARIEIGAARKNEPGAIERISERVELAEEALRKTAFELHPYALEELGLCEALKRVAEEECSRSGIALRLDCDAVPRSSSDGPVFAIARELIRNAARHSGAGVVEVRVSAADGGILLRVDDDGIGISPERRRSALQNGHLGLVSVRERAESIGAALSISSRDGGGTRASLDTRSSRAIV